MRVHVKEQQECIIAVLNKVEMNFYYWLTHFSIPTMNNYLHPAPIEPGDFYPPQIPPSSPPARSSQSMSSVSENLPLDPRLLAPEPHDEINNSNIPPNTSSFVEGRCSSINKLNMYLSNNYKLRLQEYNLGT